MAYRETRRVGGRIWGGGILAVVVVIRGATTAAAVEKRSRDYDGVTSVEMQDGACILPQPLPLPLPLPRKPKPIAKHRTIDFSSG